jgi:chaperone modulatory protein CbpM
MTYALVRADGLDLLAFAAAAGLHPELVRRLVALGAIDASCDSSGDLWFAPSQLAAVARIQRLRAGLGLNYASIGLVLDLLDRITALEAALRRARREGG